ncbi:probable cellulose synthase A catalytic subunit 8 [UDP-forming] [Hibiscus syriacus]|uniref:probable cellulose synthase A catalytic subunit 8 [UDP-forming] n=1 Tax=Hibiscus syriacus TaxID=106335 RepID=UPI0019230A53|nr:probable cellulose synthase A catalytic subunit 8 [UDP-forming] [Hibiscus syriacus]
MEWLSALSWSWHVNDFFGSIRLSAGSRKESSKSSKKGPSKKKSGKTVDPLVPEFSINDTEECVEVSFLVWPNEDKLHPYPALQFVKLGAEFNDEKPLLVSQMSLEKPLVSLAAFVAATLTGNAGVPIAVDTRKKQTGEVGVICYPLCCLHIGWIYGSVTEDTITGFKMHAYDRPNQVLRRALGSVEILLSMHCHISYGYGSRLK